jgi:hypothetical protein
MDHTIKNLDHNMDHIIIFISFHNNCYNLAIFMNKPFSIYLLFNILLKILINALIRKTHDKMERNVQYISINM